MDGKSYNFTIVDELHEYKAKEKLEILRKLIDEDAITFMKANEENIDLQLNTFLETNGFVGGIDLAEGEDTTAYTPL